MTSLLACAVGLIAVEVFARAVATDYRILFSSDPVLHHVLTPNANVSVRNPAGELVQTHINSLGMHDLERKTTKEPGVYRILVLGDSYVEGLHVPCERTAPRQLEALLSARPSPRCEVINAAVASYASSLHYLYFKVKGRRFSPDLVLLFMAFNDPSGDLFLTRQAILDGDGLPVSVNTYRGMGVRGVVSELASKLASYRFVRNRAHLARLRGEARRPHARSRTTDIIEDPFLIVREPMDPSVTAQAERAWQLTERYTAGLRDLVHRNGAKFAVTMIPLPNQVSAEEWAIGRAARGFKPNQLLGSDALQRHAKAIAKRLGVPYMPLLPGLRQASKHTKLHFDNDEHWTVAGHRAVAQITAQWIESRGLLPQPAAEERETTQQTDPKRDRG